MSYIHRMNEAIERDIRAIGLRPSLARSRERMTVVAEESGMCHLTDGDESVTVDLGKSHGGNGTTPGPGFFVRAALGACMTQGYLIWAAHLGVPIDRIKLEILTDFDARAGLGLESEAGRGFTRIQMLVEIESSATKAEIESVLETAESRDFMHAIFTEEHPIERELRLNPTAPVN